MAPPTGNPAQPGETGELGPWFHNLHLPDGTQTAPNHPLGDFPAVKWAQIAPHLPENLEGWTALDVGCNAGFYSIELARRGARVTAIDREPHFLRQAAWAVRRFGLESRIELRELQVYDLARLEGTFDVVIFMGVLYHLRYPLLGLDLVAEKVGRLLVFQTLTMPGEEVLDAPANFEIHERELMRQPGWPAMGFIEHSLAGDSSNWWAPNHACVEAMLRSAGLSGIRRLAHEIYLCATDRSLANPSKDEPRSELDAATGRKSGLPHAQGQAEIL